MRAFSPSAVATLALAFAASLLAPRAALGQTVPSPYAFIETRHEVSVFAGMATDDRGTLQLGPGGGAMLGARYGFELTGPFAVEGGITLLASDREVYDPSVPTPDPELLGVADVRIALFDARARLNLTGPRTWHGLAPFLFGGVGAAVELSGESDLDAELDPNMVFEFGSTFVGSFGGGVRWLVGERVGVRLDGGLEFWRISHPLDFRLREESEEAVPASEWSQWIGLTVGATYRF
jgi:hypothetical protein